MEFDKRTVIAFILIGLVLILIQTDLYQKRFLPQQPQRPPRTVDTTRTEVQRPEAVESREQERPVSESVSASDSVSSRFKQLVGAGEDVVVETELYRARLSTKGASLTRWTLKEYELENGQPVQIVGQNGEGNLTILLPIEGDTLNTGKLVFEVNRKRLDLRSQRQPATLEFTLRLDESKLLKKSYIFYPDRYDVNLEVEFRNLDDLIEGFSYFLSWRSGLESTEPDFGQDMSSAKAYVHQGDEESFNIGDPFKAQEYDNSTDWVAIRTKYFAVAVISQGEKGQGARLIGQQVNVGKEEPWKKYGFDLQMPYIHRSEHRDQFTVYAGPLDYDIVTQYSVGLEKIMDLGWALFRPFGKFVLWCFDLLHRFIPNYGFAIIVFSIFIKVILYPLTKKSYKSMREMQNLQPLMQEINEKYKNDPQKKQQEIMKLYKEHGVNPLGGCIPMLLQMPLLIALFQVFQSTIELRQAPFIWWIDDLSRPDTIFTLPFTIPIYGDTVNVLPIFMGVTMFIQQKMSMKDPKQKALVYFMPAFFLLIFNSFPSGLNLYYSLFNVLTIAQEKIIPYKKSEPKPVKKVQVQKRRRRKHDYRGRFQK